MKRWMLWLPLAVLGLAGCEPTEIPQALDSVQVQSGAYRDGECKAQPYGERVKTAPCLCNADITAASTGMKAIDAALREAVTENLCAGERISGSEEVRGQQRTTRFSVTRNDSEWLSVVYEHYDHPAGAAHGSTTTTVMLYDKKAQRWVRQNELPVPAKRVDAQRAVLTALIPLNSAKYNGTLRLQRLADQQLFTAEGCSGCVVYPAAEGWRVRFVPYAIAPYSAGMVEAPLDEAMIR
jgi:hypothetical protein